MRRKSKIEDNTVERYSIIRTLDSIRNADVVVLVIDVTTEISDQDLKIAGFIDEHVHGAAGSDAMDGTVKALSDIANALASEGTTSFLATTMTQSPENITKAMEAVKAYREADSDEGARVVGVHLEGPFIAAAHKGAQPLEYVKAPDIEALCLTMLPISPAVARARHIRISENSRVFHRWYNTAGSTPEEPHVGAVTIRPPQAFSSLTAKAYEKIRPRDCKLCLYPEARTL